MVIRQFRLGKLLIRLSVVMRFDDGLHPGVNLTNEHDRIGGGPQVVRGSLVPALSLDSDGDP